MFFTSFTENCLISFVFASNTISYFFAYFQEHRLAIIPADLGLTGVKLLKKVLIVFIIFKDICIKINIELELSSEVN